MSSSVALRIEGSFEDIVCHRICVCISIQDHAEPSTAKTEPFGLVSSQMNGNTT